MWVIKYVCALCLVAGVVLGAMTFDGVGDYVSIPNGGDLIRNDIHTIVVWFRVDSFANAPVLWSAVSPAVRDSYAEIISDTSVYWGYRDGDGAKRREYTVDSLGSGWHHIVMAKTGATTGNMYIDGVLQTSYTDNFVATSHGAGLPLLFCAYNHTSPILPLDGTLSYARIYSYALTAAEVAQLYLAPVDLQTGLVDANRGGAYYNHDVFTNQLASLPTPQAVQRWDTNGVDRLAFYSKLNTRFATGDQVADVQDISGERNHGTLMPTRDTGPTKVARGYFFDGGNSYITANGATQVDYPFTLSAWAKTSATAVETVSGFYNSSVCYRKYDIEITSGNVRLRAQDTGIASFVTTTGGGYADGTWYHIVGVYESATLRKLYVDGALIDTDTVSVVISAGLNVTAIGGMRDSTPGNYFTGSIDEPKIHNSTLTTPQVLALYNGTQPTNKPVLNMPFDNESYKTYSEDANHLEIISTTGIEQAGRIK